MKKFTKDMTKQDYEGWMAIENEIPVLSFGNFPQIA